MKWARVLSLALACCVGWSISSAAKADAAEPNAPVGAPEGKPATTTQDGAPASDASSDDGPAADQPAADQPTPALLAPALPAPVEPAPRSSAPPSPAPAPKEAPAKKEAPASISPARAAFLRGDRSYLEGDYEAAVLAFEEAYAQSGRIEMLFNLANAHERLSNFSQAALALRGYIPHSPQGDREALERRLVRLEELAKAERESQIKAARASAPPAHWSFSMGVGLATLGGAGLITGTGFAISAGRARKDLSEMCGSGNAGRLCTPKADPLLKRDQAHSLVADVALIGGTILSVTGVGLLIYGSHRKSRFEAIAGPGSLQLRGVF